MDQSEMERILEVLLARMDADKAESKAERKTDREIPSDLLYSH
jgi:hypothetical protein